MDKDSGRRGGVDSTPVSFLFFPWMVDHEITLLLEELEAGRRDALDELIVRLYPEIREIAARHMSRERQNHTLQPTALVNEAYIKLIGRREPKWASRAHFLGAASQVVRRVLVEHARARGREKRGGPVRMVTLPSELAGGAAVDLDLVALDEALDRLSEENPEERAVVELRFFGGMSAAEVARVLRTSTRTVERRWAYARAWLFRELERGVGREPLPE
jgi:RNA polymerase sigma factor (TIGR02999 family)